jgi:hypothetical protein
MSEPMDEDAIEAFRRVVTRREGEKRTLKKIRKAYLAFLRDHPGINVGALLYLIRDPNILRMILTNTPGIDVNARNKYGLTALFCYVCYYIDVVTYDSPFLRRRSVSLIDFHQMISILREHGADSSLACPISGRCQMEIDACGGWDPSLAYEADVCAGEMETSFAVLGGQARWEENRAMIEDDERVLNGVNATISSLKGISRWPEDYFSRGSVCPQVEMWLWNMAEVDSDESILEPLEKMARYNDALRRTNRVRTQVAIARNYNDLLDELREAARIREAARMAQDGDEAEGMPALADALGQMKI